MKGASLLCLVWYLQTIIMFTDASGLGIGGYSLTSGHS